MPRPSIAEERREEILQAFEACAVRNGLDATTLTDVAAEAGLPRSLVRYFVGNREAMVEGLIERMFERAFQAAAQELNAPAALEDVLNFVLTRIFSDHTSNRIMLQLWQKSWQDPKLRRRLGEVYRQCIDSVAQHLYPGKVTAQQRQAAYALTAMAMGHAIFSEFDLQPRDPRGLVQLAACLADQPD